MDRTGRRLGTTGIPLILFAILSGPLCAQAEQAIDTLEKGIYAEETLGDVDIAIDVYNRVLAAETNRSTTAQALYRLGMCYLKSARSDQATAAFHRLSHEYPDYKDLIERIPNVSAAPLALQPSHVHNEILALFSKSRDTFDIHWIHDDEFEGKSVSRIERSLNAWRRSSALVHPDNLQPLRREMELGTGSHKVTYGPGHAVTTLHDQVETRTRQFTALGSGPLYDETTLFHLARRLPLAEGYGVTVPYLDSTAGLRHAKLAVLGSERITVPAGVFQSYKVQFALPDLDQQEWWYSKDAPHYPLKAEPGGFMLVQIPAAGESRRVRLERDGAVATLTLPTRWGSVRTEISTVPALELLAPGLTVSGRVRFQRETTLSPPLTTARRWLFLNPAWSLRGTEPELFEWNGCPAARFIAERSDKLVQYWARVGCGTSYVVFLFQAKLDRWAESRPIFDDIISSLRVEQ